MLYLVMCTTKHVLNGDTRVLWQRLITGTLDNVQWYVACNLADAAPTTYVSIIDTTTNRLLESIEISH